MKTFKAEQCLVVELDENEWFGKTPEQRVELVAQYREEASAQNCNTLNVFAIPDPILPIYGIDRRSRVHNERIEGNEPYTVMLTYSVEIPAQKWADLDNKGQRELLIEARDDVALRGRKNPGRYEAYYTDKDGAKIFVDRGRV